MYIGHIPDIGPNALTGVGVSMPVIMAISAFAALVSMGGAPRASIMMGKGKNEEAEKIMGNCTTMLAVLAILLTVISGLRKTHSPDVRSQRQYHQLCLGLYEDLFHRHYICSAVTGTECFDQCPGIRQDRDADCSNRSCLQHYPGSHLYFGLDMGVRGAALATIISQAVSSVWVVKFLTGAKSTLRIRLKNMRPKGKYIFPQSGTGAAPFIMQFTESILSECFNTSLLRYGGDIAVGAMTILTSVMQFSMLPLQGLTQGAQPIISFNYGAENIQRVKEAFHLLLKSSMIYSSLLWAISNFVPQVFIAIFTGNAELAAYTKWAIRIYMAVSLLFGIQIACQQTFIALGNFKTSVFLALLRKVILLIPLIFILPHLIPNQVLGVFLAEPIADFLAVSVTSILFYREYHKLG